MADNPLVLMETAMGEVVIELFEDKAPDTVKNFLSYVDAEHYDGTIFHRVIANFMVQGGGMTGMMKEKDTNAPVKNEADNGVKNLRGTVAMARTMDPHSATAQFFINVEDNAFLNHSSPTDEGWGYCVFGQVSEGMEVVDKIRKVRTKSAGMHDDVPVDPVYINSIRRFEW
ncbi:peptidylprolyl isomerase [Desulfocurvus sp. DL9XJH121]